MSRDRAGLQSAGSRRRRQPPGVRQWLTSDYEPAKPVLTPSDVVAEALALIDQHGLQALSMRALAKELGVYPAAVYWHAGSKSELLSAVANAVLAEVRLPGAELGWREWLYDFGVSFRQAVQRHPNVAPLLGTTLTMTPALLSGLEGVLRQLQALGLTGEPMVRAYNVYLGYIVGYTINELSRKPDHVPAEWEKLAEEYLDQLSPDDCPTVVANLTLLKNHAIAFRWKSWQDSALLESYEFGLDVLLSGLEQLTTPQR